MLVGLNKNRYYDSITVNSRRLFNRWHVAVSFKLEVNAVMNFYTLLTVFAFNSLLNIPPGHCGKEMRMIARYSYISKYKCIIYNVFWVQCIQSLSSYYNPNCFCECLDTDCSCCDNCTDTSTSAPCIICSGGQFLNLTAQICQECPLGYL